MNIKEYTKEVKQNAIQCQSIVEQQIFNTIDWQLHENEFITESWTNEDLIRFCDEIAKQILKNIYKTIE